jgi:hypothetical protein
MINKSDLYRQTLEHSLSAGGNTFGSLHATYEVHEVTDVRNLTWSRAYRLTCTQRLIVPNGSTFAFDPTATGYGPYPVLASCTVAVTPLVAGDVRLLTYSPRTLNSAVTTARSDGLGSSKTDSRQHTTGSSTSATNTFGINASLGFFGEEDTGDFGFDFSHSSTSEASDSRTSGRDTSTNQNTNASDSMSVKDWACYASLNPKDLTSPTWIWGQEYPWDVIAFRHTPSDDVQLPQYIVDRLVDTTVSPPLVYPPSQLSEFGIDFTMKAAWLVTLPDELTEETLALNHQVEYMTGNHGVASGKASVTLDSPLTTQPVPSPPLHLTRLGLDPITGPGRGSGAVVGFIDSKFVARPDNGAKFKIMSDANTLHVTGRGFDDVMSTTFTHGVVELAIDFKVVDDTYDYVLFLKNWNATATGCTLTFVFNGDHANPVTRHVDSQEGEGGDDNLTVVALRNKDYTTIDYHDYLVMGLNSIQVTIAPDDNSGSPGYVLKALAIGGS